MATLSMSEAWAEGSRFAAREFRLLFPIAYLLLALPALVLTLVVPPEDSPRWYDLDAYVQQNGVLLLILVSVLVALLLIIVQSVGSLAIAYLALRPGTSVGEGLRVALRRLPAMVGALLLLGVACMAVAGLFGVLAAAGGAGQAGSTAGFNGIMLLLLFVMTLLFLIGSARLVMITPVAAAEPLGPLGIIRRSWQLTTGCFWQIFGTLVMLGIVLAIINWLVSTVFGLIVLATIGNPLENSTAMFVHGLLNSVFTSAVAVFMTCFVARLYLQLTGTPDARPF